MSTKPSMTREQSIKAMVSAIRQIHTRPGPWSARKAMEDFIQKTLCALVEGHKKKAESHGSNLLMNYAPRAFNFKPIEKRDIGHPWENVAVTAYITAVLAHEPYEDILVYVFTELQLGGASSDLGQFLTPPDLCRLAAEIAIDNQRRHPVGMGGMLKISDPCCGAGGLLLASIATHYKAGGVDAVANLDISANDLDPLCSAMTALQLMASMMLFQLPLGRVDITVGNTLTANCKPALMSLWVPSVGRERRATEAKRREAAQKELIELGEAIA